MEVNAKVLFTFLFGITTLASGFVIRPYENIDYEVLDYYVSGGDKEIDLEEFEPDTSDQYLPDTSLTTVAEATTISHTTTPTVPTISAAPAAPTVVYDLDDSYDEDCSCPPQFLIYMYDGISK